MWSHVVWGSHVVSMWSGGLHVVSMWSPCGLGVSCGLTQLADQVHGPVTAAGGGVEVHQELEVQPGDFPLQHVGDELLLLGLQPPLPAQGRPAAAKQ